MASVLAGPWTIRRIEGCGIEPVFVLLSHHRRHRVSLSSLALLGLLSPSPQCRVLTLPCIESRLFSPVANNSLAVVQLCLTLCLLALPS
jgi:hypothetical protein